MHVNKFFCVAPPRWHTRKSNRRIKNIVDLYRFAHTSSNTISSQSFEIVLPMNIFITLSVRYIYYTAAPVSGQTDYIVETGYTSLWRVCIAASLFFLHPGKF